jgi:hypothetical protein
VWERHDQAVVRGQGLGRRAVFPDELLDGRRVFASPGTPVRRSEGPQPHRRDIIVTRSDLELRHIDVQLEPGGVDGEGASQQVQRRFLMPPSAELGGGAYEPLHGVDGRAARQRALGQSEVCLRGGRVDEQDGAIRTSGLCDAPCLQVRFRPGQGDFEGRRRHVMKDTT